MVQQKAATGGAGQDGTKAKGMPHCSPGAGIVIGVRDMHIWGERGRNAVQLEMDGVVGGSVRFGSCEDAAELHNLTDVQFNTSGNWKGNYY